MLKLINATERKIKMVIYSTRIPSLKKELSSRTSLQLQESQAYKNKLEVHNA